VGNITVDTDLIVGGDITDTGIITGLNFVSTVTGGTSPYACSDTTLNTNLNADLWDGYQFADYLDQPVLTTSSPTHVDLTLTGDLDVTDSALIGGALTVTDSITGTSLDLGGGAITNAINTNWDLAFAHIAESGASHTYIDQSVVSGATPTFTGTNFTGIPDGALSSSYLYADGSRPLTNDWAMGAFSLTGGVNATFSGTVQAEQLTSTDDITMAGYLLNTLGASDAEGIRVEQNTVPYTGTVDNIGIYIRKKIETPAGASLRSKGMYSVLYNTHEITGSSYGYVAQNDGLFNQVTVTSPHSATPYSFLNEDNYGIHQTLTRGGTVTASKLNLNSWAARNALADNMVYDGGGSISISNTGGEYTVNENGTLASGSWVKKNTGLKVAVTSTSTAGIINYGLFLRVDDDAPISYMLYLENSGADNTAWAIYSESVANSAILGNVRIGSLVAPTVALDVTGAALISSTLGVTGVATLTGGLIIPLGTAPTPATEGSLFLDTDASANGTLMIYSNSAWRTVAIL